MDKLPLSINPCPITEAIFEIRFDTTFPDDAVFGIVYNQFKDEFQKVEQLPILQLPAAIRATDPNLKYSPHYKIIKDNFIIQIGPKVFSLANINNYDGWKIFSKKIYEIYKKLRELNLIKNEIRTALRYINVFSGINILTKSNLIIHLNENRLGENQINFTAEIPYDQGTSNLRLINSAIVQIDQKIINGSLIDVDTEVKLEKFDTFEKAVECAHITEKKLFFSLLEKEFLSSLNPIYEE
jgi:uncharacterized protein (TIGR04255 family)